VKCTTTRQASAAVWAAVILLCGLATPAAGAGVCGNGIIESGEECDPGGGLFCNGDTSQPACTTGAQCGGPTSCYFAFSCCKFNCQFIGQGATCFDGNTCTTGDHCDNVGRCIGMFQPDGTACDDSLFCNGADTCQMGDCSGHAGDPCSPATDCLATCNEASDACESTPFVPCGDDGNTCTDDVCDGSGNCTHPPLPGGTVCRPQATACDVDEVCSGGGAPCPADAFLSDGTPCGDACTTNGSCQSGECVNGVPLMCDDNDVCDGLETCDSLTGCQAGTPLDCDDGLPCTADTCDAVGGCDHMVLPDGSSCDDGQACTIIDTCVGGVCVGATPNFLARVSAKLSSTATAIGYLAVNEPGGTAKFGRSAFMADGSRVTADVVATTSGVSLFDVEANTVRGSGLIRGALSSATLPVVPSWCTMPSSACGGPDVLVGSGEVVRIGPGTYGNVSILKRGTLELDPGEFDFCNVRAKAPTAIRGRGNIVVRIQRDLRTGRGALIEPFAGTTQIWVSGKAKLGTGSEVHQTVLRVPNARLSLGRLVRFDGALCADQLRGSRSVALGCPLP
jgi:hypothetical protein